MDWVAPIWPGPRLPWVSNVLSSAPARPGHPSWGDPLPAPRGGGGGFGTRLGREEERWEPPSSPPVRNIAPWGMQLDQALWPAGGPPGGKKAPTVVAMMWGFWPTDPGPGFQTPPPAAGPRGLGLFHTCSHPRSPAATTAATWEPARAHGGARPHPHPGPAGRQAHLAGSEGRPSTSPHPHRAPTRAPRGCGPAWGGKGGGGVAIPQSRCRGAQPRCCGNGFQANWWRLAPRSGCLAHWRSSLPASLQCGLGEGLPGPGGSGGRRGSGRRPRARVHSRSAGRGSEPWTIFRPRSVPARPVVAAVLTGPGILLELVLLA